MEASNILVGCFVGLKPRDRIDFLCHHYKDIDAFRDVYRENVISIIGYMRTFEKNRNKEEGMNLHNAGHISDTTAQAAFERIMIECQTAHCGRRKLRIDFGGFVLSDCATWRKTARYYRGSRTLL